MHPGHRPIVHGSLKGFEIDKFISLLLRYGDYLVGGRWAVVFGALVVGATVFKAVGVSGGTSGSMAKFFSLTIFLWHRGHINSRGHISTFL